MEGTRKRQTAPALLVLIWIFFALPPNDTQGQAPELTGEALRSYLQLQLELLDSPEYRARELATWRLQQYPGVAIELIAKSAPEASVNSASQQIALLDHFSSHSEAAVRNVAYDTLKRFSLTKTTALASIASSSVKAIEDAFEKQAFEILDHAGADVGILDININGSARRNIVKEDSFGVEIKAGAYTGSRESLTWIRYLKSARIVSLEGEFASAEMLALVAQMANVRKILLRGTYIRPGVYETKLKPSDFLVLKQMQEIKHFEIKYMPIDDSFVPALCQLPLTESLRLFGTAITEQGKLEIAQQLDGLEIYRGNGGFLGIASDVLKPVVVSSVQPNSAAQNAGIEEGDIVTEIQGEPIKDFANLKATIAKYSPNEMLLIKLKRPRKDPTDPTGQRQLGFFELQLFVVLNEQAN